MVPKTRLELVQAVARHPLKMVCLPIPPLRHKGCNIYQLYSLNATPNTTLLEQLAAPAPGSELQVQT